jgi:hypothetical protein
MSAAEQPRKVTDALVEFLRNGSAG